jgi:hypothetical protein
MPFISAHKGGISVILDRDGNGGVPGIGQPFPSLTAAMLALDGLLKTITSSCGLSSLVDPESVSAMWISPDTFCGSTIVADRNHYPGIPGWPMIAQN